MNGHDHDRRRDEPTQHELKVSGTVTHKVVITNTDDGVQARIDALTARLKASNNSLAAFVAANSPKE